MTPPTPLRTPRPATTAAGGPGGPAGRRPRPRPRPRRRRVLAVVSLGASAVLLLAADLAAAAVGEHRMADRIAERHPRLTAAPEVGIDGFPFLYDLARGSHPRVRIRAAATTAQGQPVNASLDLTDVSERPGGTYTAATAAGDFTVPYSALGTRLGPGTTLSAADGRLKIGRSFFGFPVTVLAEVGLDGDTVTVRPVSASVAGRALDPSDPRIAEAFQGQDRTLPELPMGMEPDGVSVDADGITVHARAERVALD
ncbi:DUF2993 domain-containing protein [Streptomyces sp. NPDC090022]|uniref:LmeA family phospholipid-binding protein n=1 Tax=Streptomyces sp. NPDC090022 TaxID=3365920 RepID=UPI0037FDA683